jgi:SAM-dependent methyltransferase
MVSFVTKKLAADQPLVCNSELIPALPTRTYTFTAGPIRSHGQRYAAYLLATAFGAKLQELARYVRWLDGDGAARQYSLTCHTPPETASMLLGYRVNSETPLQSAYELEAPAGFSADMLAVTDGVPESYDRLTDHIEPVFLNRIRTLLDTDPDVLESDLDAINRRLVEANAHDTWKGGIKPEADHWRDYLRGVKAGVREQTRLDPNFPLKSVFTQLLYARSKQPVRILDVGAGPLTTVGKVWPGHEICLVPVDPLAELYDQALADVGLVPPVRTIYAEAEKLTAFFERDSFDLVVCANALDHCYNPFQAIDEMLSVVMPGGSVLLLHLPNEAENESYSGFHQWNFWNYKENFVAWNRKGVYVVNRIFARRAQCSMMKGEQLIAVLRKHEPARPAGLRNSITVPIAATRRIFGAAYRAAKAVAAASWPRQRRAS